MATVTRVMEEHGDPINPELKARVELSYDDVTMLATQVRVINDTSRPFHIELARSQTQGGGGQPQVVDIPPGQTVTRNLPNSPNARFAVTMTSFGQLDGIEWRAWLA